MNSEEKPEEKKSTFTPLYIALAVFVLIILAFYLYSRYERKSQKIWEDWGIIED